MVPVTDSSHCDDEFVFLVVVFVFMCFIGVTLPIGHVKSVCVAMEVVDFLTAGATTEAYDALELAAGLVESNNLLASGKDIFLVDLIFRTSFSLIH